jgi:hypothetical protein
MQNFRVLAVQTLLIHGRSNVSSSATSHVIGCVSTTKTRTAGALVSWHDSMLTFISVVWPLLWGPSLSICPATNTSELRVCMNRYRPEDEIHKRRTRNKAAAFQNQISRPISISITLILSFYDLFWQLVFFPSCLSTNFCIDFNLSHACYILFIVIMSRKGFHCGALHCACFSTLLLHSAHHPGLKYPQSIYVPSSGWKTKLLTHVKEPAKLHVFILSRIWVPVDGVWTGDWIYWPHTHTICNYK